MSAHRNWMLAGLAAAIAVPAVLAQTAPKRPDFGQREYESNCASCHGIGGKGNGPITDLLRKSPPDLSQLAKRNGGVMPVARLYEVIEGSHVPSHGTRDMPVWGQDYRVRASEYYMEMPYDPDAYVRVRILSLIEYLSRLQEK